VQCQYSRCKQCQQYEQSTSLDSNLLAVPSAAQAGSCLTTAEAGAASRGTVSRALSQQQQQQQQQELLLFQQQHPSLLP
jgi:hypothetical protein